ncbi:alpha/beta hydrolase [Streptomyces sp. DSM 44917]|uniref:Alpha/beta hydrolase n=1 Tax=Streptomyces boetiae TaxID=3075541 RepID=A0ABU2LH52_9ACTN|nr:alpha/beta hydrolase [Streptomyces sp. DSM 44917]MDT0310582.1 alpha/beta hydrolase [Streptomyces sp. DSM 44917]
MDSRLIRDGVRLHVRDYGGGPGTPILLLHGLAGHAGEWDTTARWLTSKHRVLALDQRGHGASERYPEDVSRAAYVADVAAVIEELGQPQVILAGQSLGAHTAMLTAAAHPARVRALAMIEGGPGGPDPEAPERIRAWLASWPVPFPTVETASAFFGGGRRGRAWASGLELRPDGWYPRFDPEVMARSLTETATRAFWEEWDQVRCPTLLVLAGASYIPAEEAEEMQRRRPTMTTLVGVQGTGHDLHLENPVALDIVLKRFLTRLP